MLVSLSKDDTIIKIWCEMMRTEGHNQSKSIGLLLYHFIKTGEIIPLGKVPKNMLFPQKRSIELYDIHPEVEEWLQVHTKDAITNRSELIKTLLHQSLEYCNELNDAWCPSLQDIRKKTIYHSLFTQNITTSDKPAATYSTSNNTDTDDDNNGSSITNNVTNNSNTTGESRVVVSPPHPVHSENTADEVVNLPDHSGQNSTNHPAVESLIKMANASFARKGVPKEAFTDINF